MLTRRFVLTAAGTIALTPAWAARAAEPALSQFMSLSASLLERPEAALSGDMGKAMLSSLTASAGADRMTALLANPASDADLANQIISGWLSGIVKGPDGETVIGYEDALMWQVLDFAHAPGVCGGATNYWADAPAG